VDELVSLVADQFVGIVAENPRDSRTDVGYDPISVDDCCEIVHLLDECSIPVRPVFIVLPGSRIVFHWL
jgi:hypothetical protein